VVAQARSLIFDRVSYQAGATTTFYSNMEFSDSTPPSVVTKSSFSSSSRNGLSSIVYFVDMYVVPAAMRNVIHLSYLRGYRILE
jgi:hypothetical protein